MSYNELSEALQDLTPEQVKIELDPSGENHKISLTVCSDGLVFIFGELSEHLGNNDGVGGDVLMKICPALKDVSAADLLCALLSGDEPEDILENLLENINNSGSSSGSSKSTILDNPKVGDLIASTREIVAVSGYYGDKTVVFKDENGKQGSVLASSWKGFGKNRKVSRK